jgi:hypothetical protein
MQFSLEGSPERLDAEAPEGLDELFVGSAVLEIDGDDFLNRIRHLLGGKARTQPFAKRSVLGGVTA